MRARNLKPGFFKNPELADAGMGSQLLFAGLWLLADKEGRLKDQPRVIKAELFSYYDFDVNGGLTVLERLGHIRRYIAQGIAVIEVQNFKKHQSPHHTEKGSDLPPCECASHCKDGTQEINGETTVDSPLEHGGNPSDSLIPDSLIQGKTRNAKRSKPKSRKTRIPDDFFLSPDLTAYVNKILPLADPLALFEKFSEQARAKGWENVDWAQAFQGYCRNAHDDSGHFGAGQYPKKANGAVHQFSRVS